MSLSKFVPGSQRGVVSMAFSGVTKLASEPVLTGGLLYLLTRGPPDLRARLLAPFHDNLLSQNGVTRLAAFITLLKVLTTAGVLRRINQALNRLAWNNWTLGRAGAEWKFGDRKEEVVLITGGSSGFGYEMVKGFSKVARVVVLDIQAFPPELDALPDVYFYQCDITDTPAVERLCQQIKRKYGTVSVLINNAGIGIGKTILETSNAESQKLLQVNLYSHLVLIREFLPGMLEQKKGHIVTIASMASFVSAPGLVDYCVSKIGALYLTEGIRAECLARYPGGEGICTTSIHPSWHQTGILNNVSMDLLEKHGIVPDPPSRVSNVVLEQVLKGRSGRICVPKSQELHTGIRNWPRWAQDVAFGLVRKRKEGEFEKDGSLTAAALKRV